MPDDMSYKVRGTFRRIPSEPHQLTDRITPTAACIVLCHLGVPEIDAGDDWELEVGGLVAKAAKLTVRQLKSMETGCSFLTSRAMSVAGETQPPEGWRNASFHVPIAVL